MNPREFLYFPIKEDGSFLTDSRGKPRLYLNAKNALESLKKHKSVAIMIYEIDEAVSQEEFEKEIR